MSDSKALEASETTAPAVGSDVVQMMRVALEQGETGVRLIERLAPLWQEERAESARIAFFGGFRSAQAELEPVLRSAYNEQTKSRYAKYVAISRECRRVAAAHGFSMIHGEEDSPLENHVRITCDLMHDAGHMVTKRVDVPLDVAGIKGNVNKTPTHAKGSTLSYGMRYVDVLIWAPELVEEDTDGNPLKPASPITDQQLGGIEDRILRLDGLGVDVDRSKLLKVVRIERLEDATETQAEHLIGLLDQRIKEAADD